MKCRRCIATGAAAIGASRLIGVAACSSDNAVDGEAATTETAEPISTTAQQSSHLEVASQFWEALADVDVDRDATLALVDPAAIESP